MPTYKNNTLIPITETIKNENGTNLNIRIEPGETKETEYILSNVNLTTISEEPYYNPLINDIQVITSEGVDDDQTITLSSNIKEVLILNQESITATVFLQSLLNEPGIKIYPGTQRIIKVGGRFNQLVIQFSDAGTIYLEKHENNAASNKDSVFNSNNVIKNTWLKTVFSAEPLAVSTPKYSSVIDLDACGGFAVFGIQVYVNDANGNVTLNWEGSNDNVHWVKAYDSDGNAWPDICAAFAYNGGINADGRAVFTIQPSPCRYLRIKATPSAHVIDGLTVIVSIVSER